MADPRTRLALISLEDRSTPATFTVDVADDQGGTVYDLSQPANFLTGRNTGDGTGDLRWAIAQADASAGADEIVFSLAPGSTIRLTQALRPITDAAGLVIRGETAPGLTVSGDANGNTVNDAGDVRVFFVVGGTVTIQNLTVAGGRAQGGAGGGGFAAGGGGAGLGGGLLIDSGDVTLVGVTFTGNAAVGGAGGLGLGGAYGGGGGAGGDGGNALSAQSGGGGGFLGDGGSGNFTAGGGGGGLTGAGGNAGAVEGEDGFPGQAIGGGGGGGAFGGGGGGDGAAGGGNGGEDQGGGGGGGSTGFPGATTGQSVDSGSPSDGGGGGFGGGGGGSGIGTGGIGGDYGGGGGGNTPGGGGFGGGGGGGDDNSGGGGFGGGGGGSIDGTTGGTGGEFAGDGGAGFVSVTSPGPGGGGGAGLGGGIFIRAGTLTLADTTFTNNDAIGGAAGTEGATLPTAGQGKGGAIFVNAGATVRTFGTPTFTGNAAADDAGAAGDDDNVYGTLAAAPAPKVTATMTVAGTFAAGGTVTYTVVLTNGGTGPQLDYPGAEFTNVLPAGLVLVSATASSGTAAADPATNTVTFDGAIPAGGSVTVTITATVTPEAAGTVVSNQGAVAYDADGDGANEAAGVTDDPATAAADDPTVFAVAPPPGVTLSVSPGRIAENGGVATVTATLSAAALVDVTVLLAPDGGAPGDYDLSDSRIVIPAGSLSGSVTLTARPDGLVEGDETATVRILSATNAAPLGGPVAVAITDQTPVPPQGTPPSPPQPPATVRLTAVATGDGTVTAFNPDGSVRFTANPFGRLPGGVSLATGDLDGDGIDEVVVGAGAGGGPVVAVYNGATGQLARVFFAFGADFRGGVDVAVGDADGDGDADVVVGAGAGGGPAVAAFDYATGAAVRSFFAFGEGFRGGVSVSVGDADGDGRPDIVVGAGPGGGPAVAAFDVGGRVVRSFFALPDGFLGGVSVAAGDVTGDGVGDLVVGGGPGAGPTVVVVNGRTGSVSSFGAFAPDFRGGIRVGLADPDGDGTSAILVGPGDGGGPIGLLFDQFGTLLGTLPLSNDGLREGLSVS